MSRRSLVRVVAIGLSVVVGLLACELLVRVTATGQNDHQTGTLGIFTPDPELGWALAPDLDVRRRWGARTIAIRTDRDGHRIPTVPTTGNAGGAIAFAGDSYVFGNEVDQEETFVHLVGQALGKRTVNLGVGGYGLRQGSLALRRYLDRGEGVELAFLVIYVGNDLESGSDWQRTLRVDRHGQLLTVPATRSAALYAFGLRHSLALFDVYRAWQRFGTRRAPQVKRTRWIYDAVAIESDPTARDRLADHRQVLLELRDALRARAVPLIVALMPERKQVYGDLSDLPNRLLISMLDQLGIDAIDLLPELRSAAGADPGLWNDVAGGHLSPRGHRPVADALLRRIDAHGVGNP